MITATSGAGRSVPAVALRDHRKPLRHQGVRRRARERPVGLGPVEAVEEAGAFGVHFVDEAVEGLFVPLHELDEGPDDDCRVPLADYCRALVNCINRCLE